MNLENEFSRLEIVVGKKGIEKLEKSHIAVFGLGGVGGFALEALARSAIGRLSIIDYDKVDISNINRQIIADISSIGKYKTDIFEQRLHNINPNLKINKINKKYTNEDKEEFFANYDYIVDAIDMVTSKISLIKTAYEKNIKIISSMGMGNKLDPTKIKLTTINKTDICKLARVMRRELKKYDITNLKCVYSTEETCISEKILNDKKMINGSTAFVPSVAGLIMASEVVRDILKN